MWFGEAPLKNCGSCHGSSTGTKKWLPAAWQVKDSPARKLPHKSNILTDFLRGPPGYHRLLPQQLLSLGKWNGISRDKGSLFLHACSLLFESMCILELFLIVSVRYLSYHVRCNFVLRLWLRIGLIFRLLDNVTSNVRFLWRSVPNRVRIIKMRRGSGFIKRANQERRVNSWLDCQSARRNLMLRSIFVTNQLYYTYIWIED